MPKPGEKIYFEDYNKSIMQPFVIYDDIECILKKINTASPNPK